MARLEKVSRRFSAARLGSFAALATGVLGAVQSSASWLWLCFAALAAFAAAFFLHCRLLERIEGLSRERVLDDERQMRLRTRRRHRPAPAIPPRPTPLEEGRRTHGPEPEAFSLEEWVVADLNILDAGARGAPEGARTECTLFAFLDWSSTPFGARRLRHMLLHPLRKPEDIRERQDAVEKISTAGKPGKQIRSCLLPLRSHSLEGLSRSPDGEFFFAGRRGLLLLANLLGTLPAILIFFMAVTGNLDFLAPLVLLLILNLVLIGRFVKRSNPERDRILLLGPLLEAWLRLGDILRESPLESPLWARIAAVMDSVRPHSRRLSRFVSLLDLHTYGIFFEILNGLTLWELRILPLASGLVAKHWALLGEAMSALGEAEALLCLSLPLSEQEGFEMPRVLGGEKPRLLAEEVGHPLLDSSVSVRNPIRLGDGTNVIIVTGSNMAGKSTYLKSVATNLVLAGAGGPVCGKGFQWTPMALESDINVRDSLDDGKSYFQAEVERVRGVVELAGRDSMLFAVFDELFRGTNSAERLAISRAILRHLRSAGILCLVATHDQALTALVSEDGEPGMENRHFQETVEDGLMKFDYRLRDGPATTRNAILLLESYGYPRNITEEARRGLRDR